MFKILEHGKLLELCWLSGLVQRLGLQYDVPTAGHSVGHRALVLHESGKVGGVRFLVVRFIKRLRLKKRWIFSTG